VLGEWPDCLVDPRDTAAFAERLKTLYGSPELRNTISRLQQHAVAQFDIERVGSQFVTLYEQAILDSDTELA
jgi:glycosyltransferase involved in cell wall biosynthesis